MSILNFVCKSVTILQHQVDTFETSVSFIVCKIIFRAGKSKWPGHMFEAPGLDYYMENRTFWGKTVHYVPRQQWTGSLSKVSPLKGDHYFATGNWCSDSFQWKRRMHPFKMLSLQEKKYGGWGKRAVAKCRGIDHFVKLPTALWGLTEQHAKTSSRRSHAAI